MKWPNFATPLVCYALSYPFIDCLKPLANNYNVKRDWKGQKVPQKPSSLDNFVIKLVLLHKS